MAISYKKLFHLMIEHDMKNASLMEQADFSANIITRMKRGEYISLDAIERRGRSSTRRIHIRTSQIHNNRNHI